MSVAIIGAGAFGTALAVALGQPVTLWARDAGQAQHINETRRNERRLPGIDIPDHVVITPHIETVFDHDILVLTIPLQQVRRFITDLDISAYTVVAACKGIEVTTGVGPSKILSDARHVAVLTGPSFAHDIARGLPTALTLACNDLEVAADIQTQLATPALRLYRTADVIGTELGGALKNVIAIGCGAVMGAGLGDSARAALMTRGFAEMRRIAAQMGADAETLMGLSGLGDLTLTCTSDQSRNYRLGLALGAGTDFDDSITVEGAGTARALRHLPNRHELDLPICDTIADLIDHKIDISGAMHHLLARPLKEE
ncbi:NAD(P)H-dependent glycerol-3-phosphate dehydrogenase [uncultured Tateyamaria sp.]|uniref:NAD(P)H-dependent glycerol-3-phosphate dehydrogenase n=1 Tax=uncultured Tateyamaria sp. TaxID=455651 RepID=UPI00260D72F7|nr:NAD(P)H-dependent glycerol-3-phosphate dehydrogenase [uncultured Tateyamaria sp.]